MKKKIFKSLIATFAMMAMLAMPMGAMTAKAADTTDDVCTHPACVGLVAEDEYIFVDYTAHIYRKVKPYRCLTCMEIAFTIKEEEYKEAHYDAGGGQCDCGVFLD